MLRFCDGDAKAFDVLFARHAAQVRAYLHRLTGSGASADDLTQTTFLSVVKGRGRFMRGAAFKPWLYAIATNAARDLHRRRRGEELTAEPTSGEVVEPKVRDAGLERTVREALVQLPEQQRTAILMHRFEGMSFAEIALAQGVSEGAVKVRAHRGYERLREILRGVWSGS
ncbi:MAG: RNA polymerase sigma factor [Archangiaceae bacterium]|nr:RNA polymerase sigma factor [Archangiaceae bacterium]